MKTHLVLPGACAPTRKAEECQGTHKLDLALFGAGVLNNCPRPAGRQLSQELKMRANDQPAPCLPNFPSRAQGGTRTRVAQIAKQAAGIGSRIFVAVVVVLIETGSLNFDKTCPPPLGIRQF